jgi:3-hydroxy-9,10-secoandrosta-1,3,5(10)-triene-9,17-dione monooxygenase reductase component
MRLMPDLLPAPAARTVAPEQLRQAMRRYITGVTVVTTLTDEDGIAGMTASSFTSVSLDPALVLVCLNRAARSFDAVVRAGQMAIHVLADDQHAVARGFAAQRGERGMVCRWHKNERGYAILERYFALLECRVTDVHDAGDHAIVVSQVEAIDGPAARGRPLVYHDGNMFGLAALNSHGGLEPA